MKTNIKLPSLVIIAILTTLTIVFWVFFSVFRVFSVKPTPSIAPEIMAPLDPTLNTQVIDQMESRTYYTSDQIVLPAIVPDTSEVILATTNPSPSPDTTGEEPEP